jgi:hypothetical protein
LYRCAYPSQLKTDYCPNTMFIYPVTENEVKSVTTSLKGNSSAGFNKIAKFLVKKCNLKLELRSLLLSHSFY